jgi:hypothetical protein
MSELVKGIGLSAGGERERPLVVLSGNFFPINLAFIQLIKKCAKVGDALIVLQSDNWDENAEILLSIKGIYAVTQDLGDVKPDYTCDMKDGEIVAV